jgi:hypothetical protein
MIGPWYKTRNLSGLMVLLSYDVAGVRVRQESILQQDTFWVSARSQGLALAVLPSRGSLQQWWLQTGLGHKPAGACLVPQSAGHLAFFLKVRRSEPAHTAMKPIIDSANGENEIDIGMRVHARMPMGVGNRATGPVGSVLRTLPAVMLNAEVSLMLVHTC